MAKRRVTDAELASVVNGYIDDAASATERDTAREKALKAFNGEVDFGPIGTSKIVSRDVSDTHGLIMPGLRGTFFASDKVAVYTPTRAQMETRPVTGPDGKPAFGEDGTPLTEEVDVSEDRAAQATDMINYIVLKECDGKRNISNAMSDGVVIGNGILKHWWDKSTKYETDTYTNLRIEERNQVLQDPEIEEVFEEEEKPDPAFVPPDIPPPRPDFMVAVANGDPQAIMVFQRYQEAVTPPAVYSFKVKRVVSRGSVRLLAMPNEEFIIDKSATVLDETTRFCAHRRRATRSELVAEGYPRKDIDNLPAYDPLTSSLERQARDRNEFNVDMSGDKATEFVEIYECYVLYDFNGDGIAERRRVVVGGNSGKRQLLVNEEWGDLLPFTDLCPVPQPHAWRGWGLNDLIGDLMKIKTVLLRGVMDNTYQQLAPQMDTEVNTYTNMDELYNPTPNGVLLRNNGKQPAVPAARQFIVPQLMPVVEYIDTVMEKRVGVSQRSLASDLDALQNQSATAVNAAQSAAQAQIEDMARNIAGGLERVFRCLYQLIIAHPDRPKTIRLRGKWVEIDPTTWPSDMDVSVNTGLGTGSRERDFAMLQGVLNEQKQMMAMLGGPSNPVLGISEIMQTEQKLIEAAGISDPERYFPDITDAEKAQLAQAQQPQGPSPEMMQAQAQIEADRMKAESQLALQKAKQDAEIELERQKAQAKLMQDREEAAQRMQLKREEAALNAQLRRDEMMLEAELTAQANAQKAAFGIGTPDLNINGAPGQ